MTLNPTENGTATYKKDGGEGGGFMLTTAEILAFAAGNKIISAKKSTGIKTKNDKEYCGLIVEIANVPYKVGLTSWELRTLSVSHYAEEGKPKNIILKSALQDDAAACLLSCNRDEEKFLDDMATKIVGKFCGCLNYMAWASKKKRLYPASQLLLFATEQESYIQTAE